MRSNRVTMDENSGTKAVLAGKWYFARRLYCALRLFTNQHPEFLTNLLPNLPANPWTLPIGMSQGIDSKNILDLHHPELNGNLSIFHKTYLRGSSQRSSGNVFWCRKIFVLIVFTLIITVVTRCSPGRDILLMGCDDNLKPVRLTLRFFSGLSR